MLVSLLWSSMAFGYAAPQNIFNAKQVIQSRMQVPVETFNQKFSAYVDNYMFYKQEFIKLPSCYKFVRHCRLLHNFLKRLMVDEQSGVLVYGDVDSVTMHTTYMSTYFDSQRFNRTYFS